MRAGGIWESSREWGSSTKVWTGRNSQWWGPQKQRWEGSRPRARPRWVSKPRQQKEGAQMGKKGSRPGEEAEHWSSRVDGLEGSEERMRVRG